jgi:hypothetical protein
MTYTKRNSGHINCNNSFAVTHGGRYSPEYNSWVNMKARCYNEKHPKFPAYGAKGITVCAEWRDDFAAFYAYVGPRPSPTHSIDRMNGSCGYQPGNVRWATKAEQSINRPGFVRIFTANGKTQTLSAWAIELGVNRRTLTDRLNKGATIEDML